MNKIRPTARQKMLVANLCGFTSTKEEIKKAKQATRGHYWDNKDDAEFVAISPDGKRLDVGYDYYCGPTKTEANKIAKLFSQGKLSFQQAMSRLFWIDL